MKVQCFQVNGFKHQPAPPYVTELQGQVKERRCVDLLVGCSVDDGSDRLTFRLRTPGRTYELAAMGLDQKEKWIRQGARRPDLLLRKDAPDLTHQNSHYLLGRSVEPSSECFPDQTCCENQCVTCVKTGWWWSPYGTRAEEHHRFRHGAVCAARSGREHQQGHRAAHQGKAVQVDISLTPR